jgi:hypothetical protein
MAMDALAVDLQLLRAVLMPELKLTLGRELMARVASVEQNGRGTLSLAGVLLEAELPDGIKPGQELRLQVRELTPERVVLGLQDPQSPPAAPAPPVPPRAVYVKERTGSSSSGPAGPDEETHTLTLRYEAPSLGPVDMRFVLDAGALALQVVVAPGTSYEAADDASGRLSDALSAALDRAITVTVLPRREPIDVYV